MDLKWTQVMYKASGSDFKRSFLLMVAFRAEFWQTSLTDCAPSFCLVPYVLLTYT